AVVLTVSRRADLAVPHHGEADLDARPDHGGPISPGHRHPERIAGDRSGRDHLPVHGQAGEGAGHRYRVDADGVRQGPGGGAWPVVDVRSPVQPVGAAAFGPDTTAEAGALFEQEDVAVTQAVRRSQAGEATSDDN